MTTNRARMIECAGEGDQFPEEQFRRNPDGSLVVPYIHETANPHYAATGLPVEQPGGGGGGRGGGYIPPILPLEGEPGEDFDEP